MTDDLRRVSISSVPRPARSRAAKVEWIARARWVQDRDRWTSSGVAAGMDMAAALLADLFGQQVAQSAATRVELEVHDDASWDPFAKIYGLAE